MLWALAAKRCMKCSPSDQRSTSLSLFVVPVCPHSGRWNLWTSFHTGTPTNKEGTFLDFLSFLRIKLGWWQRHIPFRNRKPVSPANPRNERKFLSHTMCHNNWAQFIIKDRKTRNLRNGPNLIVTHKSVRGLPHFYSFTLDRITQKYI
jgi:hypothetical protein